MCRTVYDSVLEHKCEMVNITVPQRECEQLDTMEVMMMMIIMMMIISMMMIMVKFCDEVLMMI